MNIEAFTKAYGESRNGCNQFLRHPLARSFAYSDGVQECAEAGLYWLIDVIATELPPVFKMNEHVSNMACVYVKSNGCGAVLRAEFQDDVIAWEREVEYTDLPYGEWTFLVSNDMDGPTPFRMILPTEY